MSGPAQPVLPGEGRTDYERYIRTLELLALQKPEDKLFHHDELLFQVTHQAAELWFKIIEHELKEIIRRLDADAPLEAANLVNRCVTVVQLLTDQIHILESMAPKDYHTIRLALGRGSGQDSPGFNKILRLAPSVWPHVEDLLRRRKTTLLKVYRDFHAHYEVFRLLEALTDMDMFFQLWRQNHIHMIKRIIGRNVKSLKGYTVKLLEREITGQLYPELWKLRDRLTRTAGTPTYG